MALDNYGRIMQDSAEFAMMPVNALMQSRDRQQQNALAEQRMNAEDEEEATLLDAWKQGDWAKAYAIDPESTKYYQAHVQQQQMAGLGDVSVTAKPVAEPQPLKREVREVGGTLLEIPQAGAPKVLFRAPQQPREPRQPTEFERYQAMGPDERKLYDQFRGGANKPAAIGPQSETDKKATVLFGSIYGAEKDIQKLSGGTDTSSRGDAILGAIPLDADLAKSYQSQDYKKYEAAAKRWSANLLYMKSGATATPEEVHSTYLQFFPQPGDGADVKAQKEAARMDEMVSITGAFPWLADKYNLGELRKAKATGTGPKEGQRSKSKSGKPMIFKNGQWEYE